MTLSHSPGQAHIILAVHNKTLAKLIWQAKLKGIIKLRKELNTIMRLKN